MKNCPFCGEPVEHRDAADASREPWNCTECGANQSTGAHDETCERWIDGTCACGHRR